MSAHTAENDAASLTWDEAVREGWAKTADRWDPATLALRPCPIPPGSGGES